MQDLPIPLPNHGYLCLDDMVLDLSRGLLTGAGRDTALEPKVIRVLRILAVNAGDVVTHQTLQQEVWGSTVVEPNALQRCIGQLRKAMGDDARQQRCIATFPKKGYSLLVSVSWQEQQPVAADTPSALQEGKAGQAAGLPSWFVPGALASLVLLMAIVSIWLPQSEKEPASNTDTTSSPLQVTPGFIAAYSPDGRFLVYPRQDPDRGLSHLWQRNLVTDEETRLTDSGGRYTWLAWSPDNSQLAFISQTSCDSLQLLQPVENRDSTDRVQTSTVVNCHAGKLLSPQWLDAHRIALIEESASTSASRIIVIDTRNGEHSVMHTDTRAYAYSLAWSDQLHLLAVAQRNADNEHQVTLLDPARGEFQYTYRSKSTGDSTMLHPVWSPDGKGLLLTDNGETLLISPDGAVIRQNLTWMPSGPTEL